MEVPQLKHCKRCNRFLPENDFFKNRKYWKQCNNCRLTRYRQRINKNANNVILEECNEIATSKGGICLSKEYLNPVEPMLWQCSNGHEFKLRHDNIRNKKFDIWCVTCSNEKTRELCREIIEKQTSEKFNKVNPKWLDDLEIDGYNDKLNIAFQYNAIDYKTIERLHHFDFRRFEQQKNRDREKFAICAKAGVKMIVIPYQYNYTQREELENFIACALNE